MNENQTPPEVSWDDPAIRPPSSGNNAKMERYKGVTNKTDRMLILDKNPVMIYQHFKKGFGFFRCLKTLPQPLRCAACDSGDRPAQKFNVNALLYPEDSTIGQDVTPNNIKVILWAFGIKVFNELKGIKAEWGDLTGYDLKVTCTESKYQHLTVTNCRDRLYDSSPKAKEIDTFIAENRFDLKKRLNKSLTEEQVAGVWAGKLKTEDVFKSTKTQGPPIFTGDSGSSISPMLAVETPETGASDPSDGQETVPVPKKLDLKSLL